MSVSTFVSSFHLLFLKYGQPVREIPSESPSRGSIINGLVFLRSNEHPSHSPWHGFLHPLNFIETFVRLRDKVNQGFFLFRFNFGGPDA